MPPKFYAVPHSRVVEEGESVYFQCAIAGVPTPWSTWDKDGVIATQTSRLTLKERGDLRVLEIKEVTFEDAGLYRITLENDYGRIEATARLDVISNGRHPPTRDIRTSASPRRSMSRRLMGNSTKIGGRLVLASNFRGGSVPSCKFHHDGDEIVVDGERIRMVQDQQTVTLIIDDVTEADEGVYTCLADDEYNMSASSIVVKFTDNPKKYRMKDPEFLQELGMYRTVEGDEFLDLQCIVDTFDMPFDVKWSRNGEIIDNSDRFWYEIQQYFSILAISQSNCSSSVQVHRSRTRFGDTENRCTNHYRLWQIYMQNHHGRWLLPLHKQCPNRGKFTSAQDGRTDFIETREHYRCFWFSCFVHRKSG